MGRICHAKPLISLSFASSDPYTTAPISPCNQSERLKPRKGEGASHGSLSATKKQNRQRGRSCGGEKGLLVKGLVMGE
ncbi:hypothetical protein LU290_07050 [Moraxella nasibovis]|uniref:hypothetical protein n=1 Tax=Moraxella nasibovis TaxID=2904120 RepID=UPI00241010E9|nr:hypothetical protein [Moraxella nasibovis]WFF38015.1 hypothetical protein LU290_07050 [Moraxella nasibovis]